MTFEQMWDRICAEQFVRKKENVNFTYIRDDGYSFQDSMSKWCIEEISKEDELLLQLQIGNVLDLACGNGRHIKYLMERKDVNRVVGVDVNPKIVQYNLEHGRNVICDTMSRFVTSTKEKYDAVIIMGNSLSECESLENIEQLLANIRTILNNNGIVTISYKDVFDTTEQKHLQYQAVQKSKGLYPGIVNIALAYQDEISKEKQLCYVDRKTIYDIFLSLGYIEVYEQKESSWKQMIWRWKKDD